MSLIPSESYSFPDHFTSPVAASRKPKNVESEPEPVETRRKKPAIVALPSRKREPPPTPRPVMGREDPEPVRRATAPPPRIFEPPVRKIALPPTFKAKVHLNTRAPAMDPSSAANNGNGAEHISFESLMPSLENVIQMQPPTLARPLRIMPRPENLMPQNPVPVAPPPKPVPAAAVARPAPPVQAPIARENLRPAVASNPQADSFEMFAQGGETALSKRRRIIVCESIAVGVLLPLAILWLSLRPANVVLYWIMNILTIAAAVAATIIPIFFFALTPTLPEIER